MRSSRLTAMLIAIAAVGSPHTIIARAETIAYYRFEDGPANGSAVTIMDSSGNGNHGVAMNGPTYRDEVPVHPVPRTGTRNDRSIEIDGVDDHVRFDNRPFIFHDGFGDATLEFYVNVPDQRHIAIFWTRGDDSDLNRFNIHINPGGAFGFDYRAPGGQLHTMLYDADQYTLPLDTWTHVAITRTVESPNAHLYRFYQNGVLGPSVYDFAPELPTAESWTVAGREIYNGAAPHFVGLLDEIRMTDRALSPNEFLNARALDVPGDTDDDGSVDLNDLNNVRNHFGLLGQHPGDTDGDFDVDLEDLNLVRNHFGESAAGAAAVPEPGGLALAAVMLGLGVTLSRRSHQAARMR